MEDKNGGDRSEQSEYKPSGGLEGRKRESSKSLSSLLPGRTPASQDEDAEEKKTTLLNAQTGGAREKKQKEKDEGEKGERRIGEIASGYGSMVMRTLRERTVVGSARVA